MVAALRGATRFRLSATPGPVTRSRANGDVLAYGLNLDLSIRAIVLAIDGVVTQQILCPQLIGDRREGLRQRAHVVRAIDLPAGPVGDLPEITVSHQVQVIHQAANRIVPASSAGRTSSTRIRNGPLCWSRSGTGKGIVRRTVRRIGVPAAPE